MTSTDVRLSKSLAYWLRHRPDAGGLTLDEHGWADVDAVLAALADKGLGRDLDHLRQVVARNDKQRFELSPDLRRIRARQGHSVAVEGDWARAHPPELLYHGTSPAFLPSILAEGLRRMRRHHVHLSPDVETARRVGARRGRSVVLSVRAAAMEAQGHAFFLASNNVWLTERVPPAFIDLPADVSAPES